MSPRRSRPPSTSRRRSKPAVLSWGRTSGFKGTMVRKPLGLVVPEIGSTILDIKDIDLKKPDRFVWNIPEVMPAYVAERIRKHGDRPAPKAPEPPKAGTPAGWEFIPFSKSQP